MHVALWFIPRNQNLDFQSLNNRIDIYNELLHDVRDLFPDDIAMLKHAGFPDERIYQIPNRKGLPAFHWTGDGLHPDTYTGKNNYITSMCNSIRKLGKHVHDNMQVI